MISKKVSDRSTIDCITCRYLGFLLYTLNWISTTPISNLRHVVYITAICLIGQFDVFRWTMNCARSSVITASHRTTVTTPPSWKRTTIGRCGTTERYRSWLVFITVLLRNCTPTAVICLNFSLFLIEEKCDPGDAHTPFSQNCSMGFLSNRPLECTSQSWSS